MKLCRRLCTTFFCLAALAIASPASASAVSSVPAINGLFSTSHPDPARWYADSGVGFAWDGVAGIAGYAYLFDHSPASTPDTALAIDPIWFGVAPGEEGFGYTVGLGATNSPDALALADFNGDGLLDFAIASWSEMRVDVLLRGEPPGTMKHTVLETGSLDPAVAVADVNGDGHMDLIVTSQTQAQVSVYLGDGQGNFAVPKTCATGEGPWALAACDLNGDGWPDIVTADAGAASVSVLLNDGQGGFLPKTSYGAAASPQDLIVADFNGDGHQDLAVADLNADCVSILLGGGKGGFGPKTDYPCGSQPFALSCADFNGDGHPDLAVADLGSDSVSLLLGDGNGGFAAPASYSVGTRPISVAAGDFNGDGVVDLAVSDHDALRVLLGDGSGGFLSRPAYVRPLEVDEDPEFLVPMDINGDGRPDLATVGSNPIGAGYYNYSQLSGGYAMQATTPDGIWYFHLRAVDVAGNGGPTATVEIRIDTHAPATRAPSTAVARAGAIARLRYALSDPSPCAGWCTSKIVVRDAHGHLKFSRSYGHAHNGIWYYASFRCRLAKGTYRFYVYAIDAAGNTQRNVASNRLIVR